MGEATILKKELLPALIKFVMGGGLLLIAWLGISLLPMLENISLPTAFTLPELLTAGILTIMVVLIVNRAIKIEGILKKHASIPVVGEIIKMILYLVAFILIYFAFYPIVEPSLADRIWFYDIGFLVISVVLIGMIGYKLYAHTEAFIDLFSREEAGDSEPAETSQTVPEAANPDSDQA